MNTGWIEAVMRINARITAAEARFTDQVTSLVAMAEQGQDTAEAETQLTSCEQSLILLRAILAQLLSERGLEDELPESE